MPARPRMHVVRVGILAALALGAVWGIYVTEKGGSESQERESSLPLGELVRGVEGRTQYGVCVAGASGLSVTGGEVGLVAAALGEAMERFPGIRHGVTEGCPPPAALTGERLDPGDRYSSIGRFIEPPATPSLHVVAVYFIPQTAYDAAFDESAYLFAATTEEFVCRGDVCAGVTGGLYVTPDISKEDLRYAFLAIEGLEEDPLDACFREGITARPEFCEDFYREAGETPAP